MLNFSAIFRYKNQLLREFRAYFFKNSFKKLGHELPLNVPTIKKRILIATSTGSNWPCSTFEILLAISLRLRGADVKVLVCDGVLQACQECDIKWLDEKEFILNGPKKKLCGSCHPPFIDMLEKLGIPYLKYSDYLAYPIKNDLKLDVSEHVNAGILRYYARGKFLKSVEFDTIKKRFKFAALLTQSVIQNMLNHEDFDVAVFHHGVYVPQGVIGDFLRKKDIRIANWGVSYRKGTVIFSHKDTYHHTMMDEPVETWNSIKWTPEKEAMLDDYLRSRLNGSNDWIGFQKGFESNKEKIIQNLQLNLNLPVVGLLTNVMWDAQLHFKKSAFPSMLDWIFFTIDYFSKHPEIQLVIRIHPAELSGSVPSRQPVYEEILKHYSTLPDNIFIVKPDDKISTYALMDMASSILVFATKAALELACMGKFVVVAGEAWSRGKGFTRDVYNESEYINILKKITRNKDLSKAKKILAKKYAYHLFFRRMIPIKTLKPIRNFGPYKVNVKNYKQLLPGADLGLDTICDGILNGSEFIYPI